MRRTLLTALAALAVNVAAVCSPPMAAAQDSEIQLNENCTISVLNRNVRVNPDGSWVLPNVPANFGYVRARVTCIVDGRTVSGESERFLIPPNGVVNRPRIIFGEATTPIPRSVVVTSAPGLLTALGDRAQLTVSALYADGSTRDVTAAEGTQYTISNPAIATVSDEGVVLAVTSGTVIVQATLEGASGMTSVRIAPPGVDSDEDGMPDAYEVANGLNPGNKIDAQEDPDHDGVSNLDEFNIGTNPQSADTDADGLSDGQEIARGTSPLLWDSDGDGVSDGLEVEAGTDPSNGTSVNIAAALSAMRVVPPSFVLTFNTIEGEASVRLAVDGTMRDGRTIDLTARGVNYSSSDLNVCNFGATEGQVFAGQTGSCTITATLGTFGAASSGTVRTFAPQAQSFVGIPGFANSVDVGGDFAFVAAGAAGLQVVDVSNRLMPRVVAALGLAGNANDVKLDGARAYVAAGVAGLHIIDISAPLAPRLLGTVDTPGSAFDVRPDGNLAFVADGSGGLRIVDVSTAAAPRIIGALALTGVARGVDVRGKVAVVAAGNALVVVDVTSPVAPVLRATVPLPDGARDVVFDGAFAYVAAYQASLQVVDLSGPAAPRVVGSTTQALGGILVDVAMSAPFVFGADVFFVNGVPIVDLSVPGTPIARAILDFRSFRDDNGTGIAVDGSYIYLTAARGLTENGSSEDTRLYIGQYRALEDVKGQAPVVALTAPTEGATFIEGESIQVAATATDDVGVASVSFMVNGSVVFVDTSAPYQFTVTAPAGGGNMVLSATAIDLGANVGASANVGITIVPDPLTTVVGRVVGRDLQPLAGVTASVLGRTATTGADGVFSIAGVPTLAPALMVSASLTLNGTVLTGSSAAVTPVRGGTTDAGEIMATSTGFEEFGTLVSRCDSCTLTVALPFPFTIAGRTYERIHINNGYLRTDGGDFLEAFCCDLANNSADGAGLYVNSTVPGRFVVTWDRQFTFSTGAALNTIQIVLFQDGRIQYGYRGVSPDAFAEVGLFTWKRTTFRVVDFSQITTLQVPAEEAVYQDFDPDGPRFDLDGGFLVFTPTTDGYEVRTVPDVAPPVCAITSPLTGSTLFEGEALAVAATATDNGAVGRVTFTADVGSLNADVTAAPFSVPFVVPVGVTRATFVVTAYDAWQNTGVCSSTVTVVPGPPPTLAVAGPAPGAVLTAGATIPIVVDAANRVPVTRVDVLVNGELIATDTAAPFEVLFTVPAGVTSLSFTAGATDSVGKTGTAPPLAATVVADPLTTLEGTAVDAAAANAPVSGAAVSAYVQGVTAEVFDFETPLAALPDLTGVIPRVSLVSALSLRNPGGIFGSNPYGFGTSASRAIRFSATLKITQPGLYAFTLGVAEGGRLLINGTTVIDIPKGAVPFQQATGTISLPAGSAAIQVLTFDNSTPEVQLWYTPPGGTSMVVPPSVLTPTIVPYQATSDAEGRFSIAAVPAAFGSLRAIGTATLGGRTSRGISSSVAPVGGGITDVGLVRLGAFDTLYGSAFNGPTGPATFYEINALTGAATAIGPIGFWRVGAMDTAPDGTLYAIGRNPATGTNVLLTIDRTTGTGTEIGPTGVETLGYGDTISDISFRPSDGVLFAYLEAGDGLGTVNLTTGKVTALGRTNVSCCGNGLAFAPDGRLLHANEDSMHVLNQVTGAATRLTSMAYPPSPDPRVSAMKFQPETGQLFGNFKSGSATFLVKIDPATGAVTVVGAATINGMDAMAWGMRR
jgi:hypothetical protein